MERAHVTVHRDYSAQQCERCCPQAPAQTCQHVHDHSPSSSCPWAASHRSRVFVLWSIVVSLLCSRVSHRSFRPTSLHVRLFGNGLSGEVPSAGVTSMAGFRCPTRPDTPVARAPFLAFQCGAHLAAPLADVVHFVHQRRAIANMILIEP